MKLLFGWRDSDEANTASYNPITFAAKKTRGKKALSFPSCIAERNTDL